LQSLYLVDEHLKVDYAEAKLDGANEKLFHKFFPDQMHFHKTETLISWMDVYLQSSKSIIMYELRGGLRGRFWGHPFVW